MALRFNRVASACEGWPSTMIEVRLRRRRSIVGHRAVRIGNVERRASAHNGYRRTFYLVRAL